MSYFLQMTDPVQHREHSFDQHPRIPQAPITQFEVHRIPFFGVESGITQADHLLFIGGNQGMKGRVGRIGARTIPTDHQAQLIEPQTELPPRAIAQKV